MTFNIDWSTANIDGSNTISSSGESVGVSISTPQNSDNDQWYVQHGTLFSTDVCRDELATLNFDQEVANISFTLFDVDLIDKVTILAYDVNGNLVPVTFEATGAHTVTGNTVIGDTTNNPGPGSSNPGQDIQVTIAGPIAQLVIIHDDGPASGDSGAIALSDISFDLADPALDGIVEGTAGDDIINVAYTGDPEGDMIDSDDAILPGEVRDDDIVYAGAGNDTVFAGAGNDFVLGEDGNDTLHGEDGNDVLCGNDGDDTIYGGEGTDVLEGMNGNDTLYGGAGADRLYGDAGADELHGGDGNDHLFGGAGDDLLEGGDGNDVMYGGDGQDTFIGRGNDTIFGGEGGVDNDTLDLRGAGEFNIIYDATDSERGTVQFLNEDGSVNGVLNFHEIENVIPCFTPGSLIATPKGERLVEELRMGDKIITRDNGIQEIRWVGEKKLGWKDLAANPHLKPILIQKGSLGNDLPERDMMVSPNHRMLVANDKTMLYFEEREVLAAAKHLVNNNGVHAVETMGTSYLHFMFDNHEVVLSDGAWTESFQPGDYTLQGIGNAQRTEILELFPELATAQGINDYQSARKTLKAHEARLLAK